MIARTRVSVQVLASLRSCSCLLLALLAVPAAGWSLSAASLLPVCLLYLGVLAGFSILRDITLQASCRACACCLPSVPSRVSSPALITPPPINKTLPCSHTCKKTWQKTSENTPDKHKHTTSNHHRARHNPAANPLSNKPKTPTNLNPARDKHITPAGVLLAPWRYTRSQRNPASPQRRTQHRRRRYPLNHQQ